MAKKSKIPQTADKFPILDLTFDLGPQENSPLKIINLEASFDEAKWGDTFHLKLYNAGKLSAKKVQYCTINKPSLSIVPFSPLRLQFSQTRSLNLQPGATYVDAVPMLQIVSSQYNPFDWKDPNVSQVKLMIRILRVEWEGGSEETFPMEMPTTWLEGKGGTPRKKQ